MMQEIDRFFQSPMNQLLLFRAGDGENLDSPMDLSITPGNVREGANPGPMGGLSGVAINAGQAVYFDGTYFQLAFAGDGSAAFAFTGLAISTVGPFQPIVVLVPPSQVNLGVTLAAGQAYFVSAVNPGGIAPSSDIGAGGAVILVGIAANSTYLQLGHGMTTAQLLYGTYDFSNKWDAPYLMMA